MARIRNKKSKDTLLVAILILTTNKLDNCLNAASTMLYIVIKKENFQIHNRSNT